ncbi:MAG: oligopeptide transport system substrate-binding protein, partial [Gammaproteobacteria bacterium]
TYWDRDTVKLNGIYFHPTQNITTEERMFRAGQLHYTNVVPPEKILNYRENNPESLHVSPYLGTYFYRINTRVKHLSDVRVRKALALSIDRKSLVKNVTKAGEIPAYTFTPPNTLGYTANSSESFNPDKARALLAEAGYPEGVGFPATEILYNTHEGHRKLAVAIQQMWKKELNIEIKLLNQDWKVYLDTETSGNYEISRAGWIGDYVDPNTFLDLWLKDGGNNRTGWSNEEYERLVFQEAPQAKTQEARYEAFRKAEQILLDEMPIILVYTYVSKHLVHPSVKGLPGNLMDYPSYKNMYLSDEPQSDLQ